MLQADVTAARWQQDSDGAWLCLRVQSPASAMTICDELKPDKQYVAQIKRKGRSQNANKYFWELCGRLSERVRIPPNDIYREYIRDIGGNYFITPVKESRIEAWNKIWCSGHIGRMTEDLGPCRNTAGYNNIRSYISSSDYDTEQMSRLIDMVVQDFKAEGIETMTPQELDALKSRWGEAQPLGGDKGD